MEIEILYKDESSVSQKVYLTVSKEKDETFIGSIYRDIHDDETDEDHKLVKTIADNDSRYRVCYLKCMDWINEELGTVHGQKSL